MMLDLFSVLDSSEHANVYVYFLPFNLHFAGDEMTRVIWKMIKDKVIFFLVKYLDQQAYLIYYNFGKIVMTS